MNCFRIALMGFGHIGKIHLEAITEIENAEVVAIIDPIATSDTVKVFKSFDEFSSESLHVDLIAIATPNGFHKAHAIQAIKAGYHVLIEKPICLHLSDLNDIIDTATVHNKRVFNMMQLRFSPIVQQIKNVLKDNTLGEIFMVNVQCYWNRNKDYYKQRSWHGSRDLDGGVLFTQFSHFVDILSFWFKDLKVQNSQSWNFSHKDVTDFSDSGKIDFIANKAIGNFIYSTATEPKNFESSITILAENGSLQVKGQYMNELSHFALKGIEEDQTFATQQKKFHANAYADIIQSIQSKEDSILDAHSAKVPLKFMIEASN